MEPLLDRDAAFDGPLPAADDLFAIMYTSGTTGKPKGVMVSHRMLRLSGESIALVSGAGEGDAFHMWEPLFTFGGAQMIVMPLIRPCTWPWSDRFSASGFWQQVRDYGALSHPFPRRHPADPAETAAGALDRSHGARIGFGGGCPPDVWRPFEERFGVEIRECYGMTEASSVTTFNTRNVVGSVGSPCPGLRSKSWTRRRCGARPASAGNRRARETAGRSYRRLLQEPGSDREGAARRSLHTGDIGSFDADGNMYFHGRNSDNVRVRGENVTAWEVEHVAAQHPLVEDCAMIGVAAEIGEQDIKLFVKPNAGSELDPAELSEWLGQPARRISEPALHRGRRRVRPHTKPEDHEAQAVHRHRRCLGKTNLVKQVSALRFVQQPGAQGLHVLKALIEIADIEAFGKIRADGVQFVMKNAGVVRAAIAVDKQTVGLLRTPRFHRTASSLLRRRAGQDRARRSGRRPGSRRTGHGPGRMAQPVAPETSASIKGTPAAPDTSMAGAAVSLTSRSVR